MHLIFRQHIPLVTMSKIVKLLFLCMLIFGQSYAQGLHFSQYYNAPQLLNPANTALMPMEDFSIGANYREQWTNVPAPFTTFAAHGDLQLMRNKNLTNWLGLGIAFFSDKAGNGILSKDKVQASIAYHVQLDDYNMISAGASVGYVHRSIDFNRLTFDVQWDGFRFDRNRPQNEPFARQATNYLDVMLGVNYAFFPNENFYLKLGAGLMHLNRPNESFYSGDNRLGIRPMGNLDIIMKAGDKIIINPSVYYANQKNASELVFGSMFNANLGGEEGMNNSVMLGLYYRLGESFIPVLGMEWSRLRIMFSYDITASPLAKANRSRGAAEFGIVFKGLYGSMSKGRDNFNCPRF